MSRSVVFNEFVMFNDNLSIDVSPVGSDEEQQHVSVQVEHEMIKKLKLLITMFMILFSTHLLFYSLKISLLQIAEQRGIMDLVHV